MAEENLNIYQKLAKIRKTVEVIQKNASGFGYKYVTEDEILSKLTVGMDKYNLLLIPSIVKDTFSVEPYTYTKTKSTKSGDIYEEINNEIITKADMQFTWINADNPEEQVVIPWAMVGHQTDGSQGFGTALTYAHRYFLLKFFGIATTNDDADNWRSKQRETELEEDRLIAQSVIESIDTFVRDFLSKNEDKGPEVKKLVSKYVKSGNYKVITESTVASKLLADLKETFDIKE